MEAFRRCAQALALLPIYMVAGSYWCPTLLAGGLRVDLRASGLSIAFAMTDATKPTAGGFPLLPGERLEAQQAMEWIRAAKTQLTPDQAALIAGQEPRSALKYRHSHVLPPLVAGAAGGITQNAVESRDALIQAANDAKMRSRPLSATHSSASSNTRSSSPSRLRWNPMRRYCSGE